MVHASILVFVAFVVVAAHAFTLSELIHQNETLSLHNSLRARHCTPAMQLDDSLNKIAQDYADFLARTGKFQHSNNGHGENLYMSSSSAPIQSLNGKVATQAWYDEIKDYSFSKPGFSAKTGHFTQVIWKGSNRLGVGIGFSSDKRKVYVVTNYSPPGNMQGSFPQHVAARTC